MGIWAILPVKPMRQGKSRLSGIMDQAERTALNHCLLDNTLRVLQETPQIEHTLVISRDPQVLAMARSFGCRTLLENRTSNLNRALELATALVHRRTSRGVLVIPADLPLLTSQDLQAMLAPAAMQPVVVIAPDRHNQGTNALLVSPPGLIRYAFGIGSFKRHCELARQAGARLEIVQRQELGLDLDFPEDLALVRKIYLNMELTQTKLGARILTSETEVTPASSQSRQLHDLAAPPRHCLESVRTVPHLSHEGGPDD